MKHEGRDSELDGAVADLLVAGHWRRRHRRRCVQAMLVVLVAVSGLLAGRAASASGVTAVAAGVSHTCALTSLGAVQCWGDNTYGQIGDATLTERLTPVTVSGLASGMVAVAAGGSHSCALTTGGAVWCWGQNDAGQLGDGTTTNRAAPVAVSGLASGAVAVAAGGSHTCAVTGSGGVLCWGRNTYGQIGDGTTTDQIVPVAVSGLAGTIAAVTAGYGHTCVVTNAGGVHCWGHNSDGQLGDGTTTDRLTPVAVSGLTGGAAAAAAGGYHTCALTNAGGVLCWGQNTYGQLGDGTMTSHSTPVAATGWGDLGAAVAAGGLHTCALTATGGVWCWGSNAQGQLGDGTTTDRSTPSVVTGLTGGVVAGAAGSSQTCGVTRGGAVLCWGANADGQLGDGTTTTRLTPVIVIGRASTTGTLTAANHTCTVTGAGTPKCWGQNGNGQLGDGTSTPRYSPVTVSGLAGGIVALAAGDWHTCAVTNTGAMKCWGNNFRGQLGNGTTASSWTPVDVSGLTAEVVAVTAGYEHTCALTAAGTVWCWGRNANGQLGDGTTTNRSTPTEVTGLGSGAVTVVAGLDHTCAVTGSGGVLCWGRNDVGQLGDGTTTNRSTPVAVSGLAFGVAAISAGGFTSCALTSGGGVKCWGYNQNGQLGDGTTTQRLTPTPVSGLASGVVAISAGNHACAVGTAGAMLCWGQNDQGEIGDGTTTQRLTPMSVSGLTGGVIALAAGHGTTCAVTTAGAVQCWGHGGQLGDGTTTNRLVPVNVIALRGDVAASAGHTCALVSRGGVHCWGQNTLGQLGDGTTADRPAPVAVSGLWAGAVSVGTGERHTCAATTAGAIRCWGANDSGQLGDGSTTGRATPVAVGGLDGSGVAVTAGGSHTCAMTSVGAARCWGGNTDGQLGNGTTTSALAPMAVSGLETGVTAVAAGRSHTCAVTVAGSAVCWGSNANGQLGNGSTTQALRPAPVSGLVNGVVAIAAAHSHSCAVTSSGGVVCWGDNTYGQLGDGTTTDQLAPVAVNGLGSGVVAVAAGAHHTCAVTTTGAVLCWGANEHGQLGDGSTSDHLTPAPVSGLEDGVTNVAAGGDHGCALVSGSPTRCWGLNDHGQLGNGTTMSSLVPIAVGRRPFRTDVDGNGTSDVVWKHGTRQEVWLWPMAGTTISAQIHLGTVADAGWEVRGLGDLTGDGKADMLWQHAATGVLDLWEMDGATVVSVCYVGAVNSAYAIVGVADYTGDGRSDILWRHTPTGELWLWRMTGATVQSVTWVATIDPVYAVVASGDVNGDGRADLLWRHTQSGVVWEWLLDGAVVASQTRLGTVGDPGYQVVGLADHTGDGRADILWWHATSGAVWLWEMDGPMVVSISLVGTVGDTGYRIVGTGDYDGDGMADVLWHHATRGEVWLWLMDGAAIRSATWISTVFDVGYQMQAGR